MTNDIQDSTRLAETIKSIEDQKLGYEALLRMAAAFAIGYFDQQKLIETQEKTIDALMKATSIQTASLQEAKADKQTHDSLNKKLPVIFQGYLEQAEAIAAFSPLSFIDDQARNELIKTNTAAARIASGIKLQKSRNASHTVSLRPDIKLKSKQKNDFWDKYIAAIQASGAPLNNVNDIKSALVAHDKRCLGISREWIKEWAKESGMTLKGGRPKNTK